MGSLCHENGTQCRTLSAQPGEKSVGSPEARSDTERTAHRFPEKFRDVDVAMSYPLLVRKAREGLERHAIRFDAVRKRGWAFEREQNTEGVACVAVAISYRIPATDAISCSMPAHLATADHVDQVVTAVTKHTEALARTLRREGIR